MKYWIDTNVINIDWVKGELIDNHGSGCKEYSLSGVGDDGNLYFATGWYQNGDLEEVTDIEILNL